MKININTWFVVLIVIFFLLHYKSFSQKEIIYKETESIYPGNFYVRKIIFTDSISGHTKTIDVLKKNPFNNYSFRKTGKNVQGNYIYQLSFDEVNKIIPRAFRSGYSEERRQLRGNLTGFYNGTSNYIVYKKSKEYSIISYTFDVRDEYYAVGVLGSVMVFNASGKCIYENKNIEVNINKAVITGNGKFLCYTYGGDMDENGSLIPDGYRIIDLKTGQIFLDRRHPSIWAPIVVRNLIIIGYDEFAECNKSVYVVFDSEQRCLYTKDYCFGESMDLNQVKEITDTGFFILKKDNCIFFDSFEEKFKKEIIP